MDSIELLSDYKNQLVNHNIMIVKLSQICKNVRDEFYKKEPFHINVISSAARGKLKETAHSMILHDLLHHPILLSSFLEEIVGVPADTFTKDDIRYPDQERIDLSLVSHKKNKFLIIENKVNAAEEQPGQIYRYVLNALEHGFRLSDIIILYLNSDNDTPPSLYSRSKGGIEETEEYIVPIDMITVRNYKYDILNWLKSKEKIIGPNETELKSALTQYIDYLEEYFQTKDKFKKLHDMTQDEIEKMLGMENLNIEERIQILSSKMKELDQLRSEMESLSRKLLVENWNEVLNDIQARLSEVYSGQISFRKFSNTVPELGFDVRKDDSVLHVSVVYWNNQTPYWRIYAENDLDDSCKRVIKQIITPFFSNIIESNGGWDLYDKTSKENCGLRLEKLAQIFLSTPDLEVIK